MALYRFASQIGVSSDQVPFQAARPRLAAALATADRQEERVLLERPDGIAPIVRSPLSSPRQKRQREKRPSGATWLFTTS